LMKKLNSTKRIIYLSCNPKTQKEDIQFLENHEIIYQKAFDAFPNTPHIENLIILEKN
jgi:23S rRNA (uracil1939-C5)-methyltransferase